MTRTTNVKIQRIMLMKVITIFIITAGTAQADILFYQGFDYGDTEGNLSTVGSDDWSTTSSKDALYKNTSLEHKDSPKKGGSAKTQSNWTGSANNIDQNLSINILDKNELWVSLLISSDTATPTSDTLASINLVVKQNSWQAAVSYNVGKQWGNTTGYTFSAGGTTAIITGAEYSTVGTDIMRVVYYLKKSREPEVWLNPTSPPTLGTGQFIGPKVHSNLTSIDLLRISFLGIVMNMDEFIIGDTYADVCAPPPQGTILIVE